MNEGPEIRAFKTTPRRGISVFIEEIQGQHYALAEPLIMRTRTEQEMFSVNEPTTTLSPTAAQQLIDDLWDCGLRPSEGTGSAGAMAATEKHLEDMRKIASKKLGIEL